MVRATGALADRLRTEERVVNARQMLARDAGPGIGNLDDHLRNHGFLRRGGGWALSPAFDVNPEPRDHGDDHELALFGAATLDVNDFLTKEALSTFGLSAAEARTHLDALLPLLEAMPRFAEHHGADGRSIRVMQTRLEAAATRLG